MRGFIEVSVENLTVQLGVHQITSIRYEATRSGGAQYANIRTSDGERFATGETRESLAELITAATEVPRGKPGPKPKT